MEHIIINHFVFVLHEILRDAIIDAKQIVAKAWDHEELLHHAVHVANATEVSEADELLQAILSATRPLVLPCLWLVN